MSRQVGALLGRGEGDWAQTRARRISRGLGAPYAHNSVRGPGGRGRPMFSMVGWPRPPRPFKTLRVRYSLYAA